MEKYFMNIDYLLTLNPILLALFGGIFTWGMTALGASLVFFFKKINKSILNMMLGFAAGVMVAASFWSLLLPALEYTEDSSMPWLPVVVGFTLGGLFLALADKLVFEELNKMVNIDNIELTPSIKRNLAQILTIPVTIEKGCVSLNDAIYDFVSSLVTSFEEKKVCLKYPDIL